MKKNPVIIGIVVIGIIMVVFIGAMLLLTMMFRRETPSFALGAKVGVVEITGTANIENFAFYKIEYLSTEPGSIWRAISAGTEPVLDDVLGTWDTSLVPTGDYRFRLVVTDTAGNAPLPCAVQIRVLREQ